MISELVSSLGSFVSEEETFSEGVITKDIPFAESNYPIHVPGFHPLRQRFTKTILTLKLNTSGADFHCGLTLMKVHPVLLSRERL